MEDYRHYINVLAQLFAAQAEVEAIKQSIKEDEQSGRPLTYNANDLFKKADEMRSIGEQLYRY